MKQSDIFLPMSAMAGLTAVVWIELYRVRIPELFKRKINPDHYGGKATKKLEFWDTRASDKFKNLCEVPVLFYALCPALAASGMVTPGFIRAAWAYVALRAVHSLVHCTYNKIPHRFYVYASSTVLCFGMWATFAYRLLKD
eukprot:EC124637.1.p2 GENE.EC124637.1~~EC124637.1.p2  ORF type:complete len:141 (+),score=5.33 EC124637.1:42-464(+)